MYDRWNLPQHKMSSVSFRYQCIDYLYFGLYQRTELFFGHCWIVNAVGCELRNSTSAVNTVCICTTGTNKIFFNAMFKIYGQQRCFLQFNTNWKVFSCHNYRFHCPSVSSFWFRNLSGYFWRVLMNPLSWYCLSVPRGITSQSGDICSPRSSRPSASQGRLSLTSPRLSVQRKMKINL